MQMNPLIPRADSADAVHFQQRYGLQSLSRTRCGIKHQTTTRTSIPLSVPLSPVSLSLPNVRFATSQTPSAPSIRCLPSYTPSVAALPRSISIVGIVNGSNNSSGSSSGSSWSGTVACRWTSRTTSSVVSGP